MKKINKNTDEYQRGYEDGFKDGVLKERNEDMETLEEKADRKRLELMETNKISEENKPRFEMDKEIVFGIEEKEHLSKEQKEDKV